MLVNILFLNTINNKFNYNVNERLTSYKDLVYKINTKEDLIGVFKSLDKIDILTLNEGLIRVLVNWEKLYLVRLNNYLKKYNVYSDTLLDINTDTINEMRKFVRNKDYEQLIIIHSQVYFDRLDKVLNKFSNSNLFLPAINNEIRIQTLLELENSLYF